jgi:hypothetical protein
MLCLSRATFCGRERKLGVSNPCHSETSNDARQRGTDAIILHQLPGFRPAARSGAPRFRCCQTRLRMFLRVRGCSLAFRPVPRQRSLKTQSDPAHPWDTKTVVFDGQNGLHWGGFKKQFRGSALGVGVNISEAFLQNTEMRDLNLNRQAGTGLGNVDG